MAAIDHVIERKQRRLYEDWTWESTWLTRKTNSQLTLEAVGHFKLICNFFLWEDLYFERKSKIFPEFFYLEGFMSLP